MQRRRFRPAFVITVACTVGSGCASAPPVRVDLPSATSELPHAQIAEPPPDVKPATQAELDRDGDRIADMNDRCPDEPEDLDGHEDEDGCPERVRIITSNPPIPSPVEFDHGSIQPTKASLPTIDEVAATLKERTEIAVIVVEGHDDPSSPRAAALKLAQARAKSVVQILVEKHGIDATRLRAVGLGAYCPVAKGTSEAERQRNRRVRFLVTRTTDGPTGAEVGCETSRAAGIADPDATPPKP